jgi:hypothetical protein
VYEVWTSHRYGCVEDDWEEYVDAINSQIIAIWE